MKKWILRASVDGVKEDYTAIIHAKKEPAFWTCYDIATANGCTWWSVEEAPASLKKETIETIKTTIGCLFGAVSFYVAYIALATLPRL